MYYHIEAKSQNNKITYIKNVKLIMLLNELKWITFSDKIKEIKITTSEKEK